MKTYPQAMRHKLIAKIHIAKTQLGMIDEEYRDLLKSLTDGKESCRDCDELQLDSIMQAMIRLGFKTKVKPQNSPQTRDKTDHDQIDKIRALWIDMGRRGIVRTPTEPALRRYCKRITKVDRVEWMSIDQCSAVIAGLNVMANGDSVVVNVDAEVKLQI
jgi:phage gp16-like protein